MSKLTEPQVKCLTYFRALADKDKETLKTLRRGGRGYYPNQRVIEGMYRAGNLSADNSKPYGATFSITEAGRKALSEHA